MARGRTRVLGTVMGGLGSGVSANQCGAKTRAGKSCKRPKVLGTKRCRLHGGMSPSTEKQRAVAAIRDGLGKLVTPVDENDTEIEPFAGFKMEIRRTLGAIRYYEEKIASLREDDAFWGITRQENVNATEYPGTNVSAEAKPNAFIVAWQWERVHLLDLHKVWIAAKLDERWLALQTREVDQHDAIITSVVVGLGHDPRDPEVRDVVRRSLLGLTGRTPAVIDA